MDAKDITLSLRGKWYGSYGAAPCPVCQSDGRRDQNALSLADAPEGRLLAHCKKLHCSFTDILAATGVTAGDYQPPDPAILARHEAERQREAKKMANQARRCWDEAQPIEGTPAEAYLRGRAITCALPPSLRFHPRCWHGPTSKRYPALVARIDGADRFAVHRTYLMPDGSAKADLETGKMMLGNAKGGAVRLSEGHLRLAVAEGIETSLSLLCGLLREPASVWAGLSTSGVSGLALPRPAGHLTIAPDGDMAGRKAAFHLAERANALGWQVDLITPPAGSDWNDVLRAEAAK